MQQNPIKSKLRKKKKKKKVNLLQNNRWITFFFVWNIVISNKKTLNKHMVNKAKLHSFWIKNKWLKVEKNYLKYLNS